MRYPTFPEMFFIYLTFRIFNGFPILSIYFFKFEDKNIPDGRFLNIPTPDMAIDVHCYLQFFVVYHQHHFHNLVFSEKQNNLIENNESF
jgi:hypothetical protein